MTAGRHIVSRLMFFSVLFCAQALKAQTYEPGRGILLPNRTQNAPGVLNLNNNNGTTIIQRGQITRQPNNAAPSVVNPTRNNSGGSSESQRMTDAYAAHLYAGVCSQEYRERIAPKSEPNLDQQKLWSDIQASCKCMSQELLNTAGASGLADYVMYNFSADSPNAANKERATYLQSGQSNSVTAVLTNAQLRQKCGFLK